MIKKRTKYQGYFYHLKLFFFFLLRNQADKNSLLERNEMEVSAEENIPRVLQNTSKILRSGRGELCFFLV